MGVAIFVVVTTNLNVIIADIYYKTGDAYDKSGRWEGSIPAYQKALNLAPSQDFYYLFLGRAFMELAKRVPDAQRAPATYTVNDLMTHAHRPGVQDEPPGHAQRQPDLAAGGATAEPVEHRPHSQPGAPLPLLGRGLATRPCWTSRIDYYRQATEISPNTAHLYDEWSLVYFIKGQYEEALAKLQQVALRWTRSTRPPSSIWATSTRR